MRIRQSVELLLCLSLASAGCASGGAGDAGPGVSDTGAGEDAGPFVDDAGPVADSGAEDGGVDLPDTGAGDGGPCEGAACLVPDPPVIDGEPSAGHPNPAFTWSAPMHAVRYRYRFDGGPWVTTMDRAYTASGLAPGAHVLDVEACNVSDACSAPASFTTVVEERGPGYPGVWSGVERPNLTTTAIGHVAPISCHNCYNGPANEVFDAAGARAKIARALSREADLIELDVSDAGGTLCVHHDDPASCAGAPSLEDILSDAQLRASDALLFVEIKERGTSADAFATQLLTALDAHRDVVRNGRPIFLRAFSGARGYLTAISTRAADFPMIAPYLRYSVLYGRTSTPVATLQSEIASDVAAARFDMVELDYRQANIAGLASYARSLGLAVGVYTIPGSFGEVFLAALREEVDQLTAEYRIDQARLVVEEENTYAYVNSAGCASASDTTVAITRNHSGVVVNDSFTVGRAATGASHGTPGLHFDAAGEDRYGCSLDFRASRVSDRAVDLGRHHPGPGAGYLVTAIVNFDDLSSSGTQAIVNNAEAGGFALELHGDGATTNLRFGVHIGGSYRYHDYDVAGTGLGATPSLNGTDSYFLVGAYDGDGGVYLFIDQDRVGSGGTHSGDVTDSGQPVLIGADPQPAAALGARFFFDGFVQQVSVLAWGDHRFTGSLVND